MTAEQEIFRARVGLLELPNNDGLEPRQFLPLQGAVRQSWRAGVAGDHNGRSPAANPDRGPPSVASMLQGSAIAEFNPTKHNLQSMREPLPRLTARAMCAT